MNLLHLIVTVLLNRLDLGCDYRLEESFNKKISLLALGNCSKKQLYQLHFSSFVTRCEPEEPEDILYDGSILQDQRLYPLPALRDIYNDCDHSLVRFSTAHHMSSSLTASTAAVIYGTLL